MSLRRKFRPPVLAALIGLAALASAPAAAVEPLRGSKNFTAPGYVPNYFSNEAGAVRGAKAGAAQAAAGPMVAPPAPQRAVATSRGYSRHQARRTARAHGRLGMPRGKANAHRHVSHANAARSSKTSRPKVAHAMVKHAKGKAVAAKRPPAPAKGKAVAAKRPPAPAKGKHLARAG
ncbi:MAG TPA: hypothetical protein VGQ90_09785 [Stellaceae bacterium]|nr:hypothetical protein [Stellaceae bacterium]